MNLKCTGMIEDSVIILGTQHFKSYLIKGERYALIEAGISCSASLVLQQFNNLGLDPRKLEYILIMHAHPDHVTGIPYLLDVFPWARVVGSATAQRVLSKEKVVQNFYNEDRVISLSMLDRGEINCLPFERENPKIPIYLTVQDGDELDLGGDCRIRIIDTPGHSLCSISAYLPSVQTLFISDAGGFISSPGQNFPCFFSGFQSYLDSLQRLKDIGARVIAPAHNKVVTGRELTGQFWEAAEQAALQMGIKIGRNLEGGEEFREIVNKIFQEQYRDDLTIYSEKNILGCIEALVKRISEEGKDYFK